MDWYAAAIGTRCGIQQLAQKTNLYKESAWSIQVSLAGVGIKGRIYATPHPALRMYHTVNTLANRLDPAADVGGERLSIDFGFKRGGASR